MYERTRDKNGKFAAEHNGKGTKLYRVWMAMRERCSNPHNKSFKNYGGRGITVCREWDDFGAFRAWAISAGYAEGLTIDRINGSGGYCPDNCRWATTAQQNRNYRRNHIITLHGVSKCAADWADEVGVKACTIIQRLKRGKTVEEALAKRDYRTTK